MPATIQKILNPTKYRAVDTSTSLQPTINVINDGGFSTDVAESTTGTYWITGDDCVISSGSATWTNDSGNSSGNCTQTNLAYALENETTYRVTFTLSGFNQHGGSGGFRIKLHADAGTSAIGTTRKADGTYVEDLTITSSSGSASNQVIIQSYGDPMSGTIDNISVEKLESFGNNNHGQIYSGRGLEFDGVSDYLDTGTPFSETSHTVACWVYMNSITADKHIFDARDSGSDGIRIMASNPSKLEYQLNDDSDNITSTVGYDSTWVRAVFTYDGTTQKIYINGILDTSLTVSETIATTTNAFIGARNFTSATNYFDGKLSDFQAWDTAWTQSDVTFDYLNPESLALNNGGTSLTESNLKLWYPMQDGHRGQQSYILDGANTGLGSEEIVTGWNNNDFTSLSSTGTNITSAVSNGSANHELYSNAINMTSGDTFKVTFTLGGTTGSALRFYLSTNTHLGSADYVTDTLSTGTHTFYINSNTTDSTMFFGFRSTYQVCDFSVSNFSAKRVNHKHHATTVFTGDELASEGDFENAGAAWSTSGSTITATKNTGAFVSTGDADGGFSKCLQDETLIEGRTYKLEFEVTAVTGSPSVHNYCGALTKSLGQASISTFTDTFVASSSDASTGGIEVRTICANGESVTIDNISFKEVGVASGWTDADQQLDIAQTALQSYNQLAWFDGKNDRVICNDGFTPGDHTTVAFWVYMNGADGETRGLFDCINWNTSNFRIQANANNKLTVQIASSGTTTSYNSEMTNMTRGEWIHCVVHIPKAASSTGSLYVNGEQDTYSTTTTMVPSSRDINIGYGGGLTQSYLNGVITEVSVWNTTLSSADVQELYNNGKGLNVKEHSKYIANNSLLTGYWRNNGLAQWDDLAGSNHGVISGSCSETLLLPVGVDASRDTQGFIMNRQRLTNSFNSNSIKDVNTHPSYNKVQTHPLYTGSAVTNYSISFWTKIHIKPSDFLSSGEAFHIFDTTVSNAERAFKINLNHNNTLYLYSFYGSSSNESVYADYDLDNLGNAIQSPPTTTSAGIGEAFDENKWYHVTFTFDHDRTTGSVGSKSDNTNTESHNFTPIKLYINGIQVSSEGREGTTNSAMTTARSMQNTNAPLIVGSDAGADGNPAVSTAFRDFPGEIDDACFYSDTLTDEEVLRNYKAGKRSHR